jgi:hypothetical protein
VPCDGARERKRKKEKRKKERKTREFAIPLGFSSMYGF